MNKDPNNLRERVRRFIPIEGEDAIKTDSEMTEFVLDNCEIYFREHNTFFCDTDLGGNNYPQFFEVLKARFLSEFRDVSDERYLALTESCTFTMLFDFGHTSPNWTDVISLGFSGLRDRVLECARCAPEDKRRFYDAACLVYRAAERFIERCALEAEKCGRARIAEGLRSLLTAPPKNLFEALQMLLLFHFLQHFGEETWIRTFGRIDRLLYPFYLSCDKDEARELIRSFIAEINGHGMAENQPFALGGSDKEGNDLINELSYIILEEYKRLAPPYVKVHVICTDKTPESFLRLALCSVRDGANSICFFGDEALKRSLLRLGIAPRDTVNYHIDGCYECGGEGELTSPATSRVNIAKAIELALNDGKDALTGHRTGLPVLREPQSCEEFYLEFIRQLKYIVECVKYYTGEMEKKYPRLHAGLFFTSTHADYVRRGVDVFAGFGAKYNNTSITAMGLATAVDSLLAVKKLVYDDKTISLGELSELMRKNWQGREALRLTVKNKFPKYGMGSPSSDGLAARLVRDIAEMINGVPNAKGGVYRLGLHSINVRWLMGRHLGATPDGRLLGESISLNTGASLGADRDGITAHIRSVTAIDSSLSPNSVTLDLDFHSSATRGECGLDLMYSTLKTYLRLGGFSVHFNVLSPEVLRAAQAHPELYPNLQVRVCGWNYLFQNLKREEQDDYIVRAERQAGL